MKHLFLLQGQKNQQTGLKIYILNNHKLEVKIIEIILMKAKFKILLLNFQMLILLQQVKNHKR